MADKPIPPALPPGAHARLLYSEFPLARFGYGQAGSDYIAAYTAFAGRHAFLKLLPLYWYTLYRVDRDPENRVMLWSVQPRSAHRSRTAFRNAVRH
jgi:hypothetical protein